MANEKRLIDANALIERLKFKRKISEVGLYRGLESPMAQVEKAPTVDAVEVVHGRWRLETDEEEPNGFFKQLVCTACNKTAGGGNYCPNCGADMRGETE